MAKKKNKKPKLNLTVAPKQKALADKMAKQRKRSISNLFEVLVDEEWERTHGTRAKN